MEIRGASAVAVILLGVACSKAPPGQVSKPDSQIPAPAAAAAPCIIDVFGRFCLGGPWDDTPPKFDRETLDQRMYTLGGDAITLYADEGGSLVRAITREHRGTNPIECLIMGSSDLEKRFGKPMWAVPEEALDDAKALELLASSDNPSKVMRGWRFVGFRVALDCQPAGDTLLAYVAESPADQAESLVKPRPAPSVVPFK